MVKPVVMGPPSNRKLWSDYFTMFLPVMALIWLIAIPSPQDDLLRHMTAWQYNYDYSRLYVHSWLPSFDNTIGFDVIVGCVKRSVPMEIAPRVVQGVILLLFTTSLWWAVAKSITCMPRARWRTVHIFLVTTLTSACIDRVCTGRPSEIFTCMLVVGLATPRGLVVSAVTAALIAATSPLYWLWWVYVLPIIGWRVILDGRRAAWMGACGAGVGIAFWLWYAGAYQYMLCHVMHIQGVRSRVMQISEGAPSLLIIGRLEAAIIIGMTAWLVWDRYKDIIKYTERGWKEAYVIIGAVIRVIKRDIKSLWPLLMACYFMLPNQIRYAILAMLTIALYLAREYKWAEVGSPATAIMVAITTGCIMSIGLYGEGGMPLRELRVLPGSTVFTMMDELAYETVYWSPGIRISPSMELGWVDKDVQAAMRTMYIDGRIYSSQMQKLGYDTVIENTLATIPCNFKLIGVMRDARIWRIENSHEKERRK